MERLRPPEMGECLVLDPCAGEGKALVQLAQGLKAVPYGIELSQDRAARVRESLPEGLALAPADFLRCAISPRSEAGEPAEIVVVISVLEIVRRIDFGGEAGAPAGQIVRRDKRDDGPGWT